MAALWQNIMKKNLLWIHNRYRNNQHAIEHIADTVIHIHSSPHLTVVNIVKDIRDFICPGAAYTENLVVDESTKKKKYPF